MKIVRIILVILVFAFGILLGFSIKNFPLIKWNHEVKIYEAFQVATTLFIALAIPFFIKKWIDDRRVVKTLLNEEAKDIFGEAKKINETFLECYKEGRIDDDDKKYISASFSQLENLILAFESSIGVSFKMKYFRDFQDVKIAYFNYWHNITDGELMSDSFINVTHEYLLFYADEYYKFLSALRKFNILLQTK